MGDKEQRQAFAPGDTWTVEANVDDPGQIRLQKMVCRYNPLRGVLTAEEQIQELPAAKV